MQAVHISLVAIRGLNDPEVVLDLVRREETDITKESLEAIIKRASEINIGLKREGVDVSEWYFGGKAKVP